MSDSVAIIPTYNESGNINNILENIQDLSIKFDVIVVDDNSPDGTGDIIKDLIVNIMLVILSSLLSLIFFQFLLNPSSLILSDVIDIGKAVSFSGFIAIPLILFMQHNLKRTVGFSDSFSYSFTYFAWVLSSQIFL